MSSTPGSATAEGRTGLRSTDQTAELMAEGPAAVRVQGTSALTRGARVRAAASSSGSCAHRRAPWNMQSVGGRCLRGLHAVVCTCANSSKTYLGEIRAVYTKKEFPWNTPQTPGKLQRMSLRFIV